MWMQNIPLHYVVNLFFWRFAVIFLPDFISNCVYTANLETPLYLHSSGITGAIKASGISSRALNSGYKIGIYKLCCFRNFAAKKFLS